MPRQSVWRSRVWGDWRRQSGLRAAIVSGLCWSAGRLIRPSSPDRRVLPSTEAPNIVVIKPLALGDVLQTTPFLDALRRAIPQARIAYAVSDYSKPALANNPHIDEIVPMGTLGTPHLYDLRAYATLVRELRGRAFEIAFVLDRSPLMALLPYFAQIPYRIGIDSRGRGFAHTLRVAAKSGHQVAEYLAVAQAAGVDTTNARSHFYPTPRDRDAALRLIQEFGLAGMGPLTVMAPGGGVNPGAVDVTKRWPAERFARVADTLVSRHGANVVMIGLRSDAGSIEGVRRAMHFSSVDLSGQTSFGQLAALIAMCDLFVGNDSVAGHLAACVGTPSVTVFTSTSAAEYGPYGANAQWVQAGERPGAVDVDAMVAAASEALRRWRGETPNEKLRDQRRPHPSREE